MQTVAAMQTSISRSAGLTPRLSRMRLSSLGSSSGYTFAKFRISHPVLSTACGTSLPAFIRNPHPISLERPAQKVASSTSRSLMTDVKSADEFKQKINTDKLVVIQYSASWCAPCRQISPVIRKWADELPDVEFLYVDIDEHSALTEENKISSVPTFVLMKGGKVIDQVTGADKKQLEELVMAKK